MNINKNGNNLYSLTQWLVRALFTTLFLALILFWLSADEKKGLLFFFIYWNVYISCLPYSGAERGRARITCESFFVSFPVFIKGEVCVCVCGSFGDCGWTLRECICECVFVFFAQHRLNECDFLLLGLSLLCLTLRECVCVCVCASVCERILQVK